MASADVISQLMVEDKSLMSFDAWRSLRFGGLGVCFVVSIVQLLTIYL